MAVSGNRAFGAIRPLGFADIASEQHQPVIGVFGIVGGQDFQQVFFYLQRGFAAAEVKPVRNAHDMCVDGQRRFAEPDV